MDQDATLQYPEDPDSEFHGEQDFPKKPDCADLIAQTGSSPESTDYPEALATGAEDYPGSEGGLDHIMVSEWKLIETDGVEMIEIQMPFMFRHESEVDNGGAMLLIEHDGFVRVGIRLPETLVERVITVTYNETAFATPHSIVEMSIDRKE